MILSSHEEVLEIDGTKNVKSEFVCKYRTNFGVSSFCSPQMVDYVERLLNLPKPLPKGCEWLTGRNLCLALKLTTLPERIGALNAILKSKLSISPDKDIGDGLKLSDVLGKYNNSGNVGYFVRKDYVGLVVTKAEVLAYKRPQEVKMKESFSYSEIASIRLNNGRYPVRGCSYIEYAYAVRLILINSWKENKNMGTAENPIFARDIIFVKESYVNKREYLSASIKKEYSSLITYKMIKEQVLDLKYWELQILEEATKARRTPQEMRSLELSR